MLLQAACAGPLNKSLTVFSCDGGGGGVVWGFREGRCDLSSGLSQPGGKSC